MGEDDRILVTGAGGFIGSNLVHLLADRGYSVRAMIRPASSIPAFPRGVETVFGDVRFATTVADAAQGCRTAFHLAARMSGSAFEDYRDTNVRGSEVVARALGRVSGDARLVFVSSVAAMGSASRLEEAPRVETDPCSPADPYGLSKLEAEHLLADLCRSEGIGLDIVRPAIVYGPGDSGLISGLIYDVKAGRMARTVGAKNHLTLVYIDHLVDWLGSLLNTEASGRVFIAADPDPPRLNQLLEKLSEAVGRPLPRRQWLVSEGRMRAWVNAILSRRSNRNTSLTPARLSTLQAELWFSGESLLAHLSVQDLIPFEVRICRSVGAVLEKSAL